MEGEAGPLGHEYAGHCVADFGCGSCGWWRHGFAGVVVVLGMEVAGFAEPVKRVFDCSIRRATPGDGWAIGGT